MMGFGIFRRTTPRPREIGGYFVIENLKTKRKLTGHGQGEFVVLHDEDGSTWRGSATQDDRSIYLRLRSDRGGHLSGYGSDRAISLRDERGGSWRGYMC